MHAAEDVLWVDARKQRLLGHELEQRFALSAQQVPSVSKTVVQPVHVDLQYIYKQACIDQALHTVKLSCSALKAQVSCDQVICAKDLCDTFLALRPMNVAVSFQKAQEESEFCKTLHRQLRL